jgi:hypothetical protein
MANRRTGDEQASIMDDFTPIESPPPPPSAVSLPAVGSRLLAAVLPLLAQRRRRG